MDNVKKIYQELILKGKYNEEYANNVIEKDRYLEGVCIDFSKYLVQKLQESGYKAHIISTRNEDGSLHAAVVYSLDEQSEKLLIADPVTDIRMFTEKKLDNQRRKEHLEETMNYARNVESYIGEMGNISLYNVNIALAQDNIENENELKNALINALRYNGNGFNSNGLHIFTGTGYDVEKEKLDTDKTQINASKDKIMENVNENMVEKILPNEYEQEWMESGEESYYDFLLNKAETERKKGNEELASHIDKVYSEACILEEIWQANIEEEERQEKERERREKEEFERRYYYYDDDFPEETKDIETEIKNEEDTDFSSKTVEELEAIISKNDENIVKNDKEIKDRLIQKILEQQNTIAEQQEEIDRLKNQKVIK